MLKLMLKSQDKKKKKHKKRKHHEDDQANGTPRKKSKHHHTSNGEAASPSTRDSDDAASSDGSPKRKVKSAINGVSPSSQKLNDKEVKKEAPIPEGPVDPDAQAVVGAFKNFSISEDTVKKLTARGIEYLFPIQSSTFNLIYEGHDVIARARTGTGKTFAFALPIVELLQKKSRNKRGRSPRVLVLAPTRELAKQVADDFTSVSSGLTVLSVYGGVFYEKQETVLDRGVDVVVGTPGRIQDLIDRQSLSMEKIKYVILDEVDRMLDMGFADEVDKIISVAYQSEDKEKHPQTLLFSATLPEWVHRTAQKYMRDNRKQIDLVGHDKVKTATTVQHLAIKCNYQNRAATIGRILQVYSGIHGRAMVFCETKRDADELAVSTEIKQETHVLHGDIPQEKREMVLKKFREGRYKCLITTDVAARGLDIPEVNLIIQCNPPKDVDSYIHRAGRTGRAGKTGTCICFYKPKEEYNLATVERRAVSCFTCLLFCANEICINDQMTFEN